MREEKRRRRGNEAVWPYIRSRLIQTKKRKHPKQVIMQTVRTTNGSAVTHYSLVPCIMYAHIAQ